MMMVENTNKYQVMPPLSDEEYQALKEDIAENGVQVPIVKDADGNIIDGYHRAQAWQELNSGVFGRDVPMYPTTTRSDLATDAEKRDLAWRLNMQRRHLNQAQKRDAIVAKLKETPHWADNRLAQLLGVDHKTVRRMRNSLEDAGEIPKHERLEGKDGKYHPRDRPGETKAQEFWRFATGSEQASKHIVGKLKADQKQKRDAIAAKLRDLEDDEKVRESLVVEPATEEDDKEPRTTNINIKQPATALRGTPIGKKMLELDYIVGGYDKIESEAGPEAVAEAVVELLGEWIESFVPLVEAKLEDVDTDS